MGTERRLYSATDRDGIVYRRWLTTEDEARRFFDRYVPEATMLVGPQGETVTTR
jgi:hypothetical protein